MKNSMEDLFSSNISKDSSGTKIKNNLDELKSTLESIRAAKYPEIPADVISAIIDVQNQYQDIPAKRQSETQKLIFQYANQIKADGDDEQ